MAAPLDAAAVSRVIDHINKNHAEAVDDWAQYYARLPASLAKTATLSTFTLEKLTLSVTSPHGAKSTVNIPLNPPMKSVNDCRERMAYMAIEAMEGLGRSRYQVKRWVPPGFVGSIVCAAVSFGYWAFFNGATQFARGGWLREYVPSYGIYITANGLEISFAERPSHLLRSSCGSTTCKYSS
jgi:hypothetical protein